MSRTQGTLAVDDTLSLEVRRPMIERLGNRVRRLPEYLHPAWVLVVLSLIILSVLSPQWLLVDNTPSGGDMGAHVLGPAALRDVLLPSGRILGWSNAWFAGFPLFYFYFPLPSLVIVLLDVVFAYGVAFKLVTVGGLLLLPFSAYFLARSIGFPRLVCLVSAATGTIFALMEGFTIYGGNVASTLAGEFSYSWSFSLGFIYLGLLIRVIHGQSRLLPHTVLVFAATALCHVLTTLLLIVGTLGFLTLKKTRRPWVVTSAWAFCLAGFWAVPLLANLSHSSDMAWYPLIDWGELFPTEMWVVLPLFPVGVFWALRRGWIAGEMWKAMPLLIMTVAPVVYYPLPIKLTELFPTLFLDEHWKLYNGRPLPYWFFGVVFFAMLAIGAFLTGVVRRLPRYFSPIAAMILLVVSGGLVAVIFRYFSDPPREFLAAIGVGAVAGIVLTLRAKPIPAGQLLAVMVTLGMAIGSWVGVSFLSGWSEWNYSGYENKDAWPEYRDMNTLVASLEPGRVLWENNNDINKYGTPMAPMLIPYWSNWTHPSMEGLYFESSMSMPYIFITVGEMSSHSSNPVPGLRYYNLALDRGLRHLDMFGVRYYISFTPEAEAEASQHPKLRKVGAAEPFHVYEAPPTHLVEVARFQPSIYEAASEGEPDFFNFSLRWFDAPHLSHLWVVDGGPPESNWATVSNPSQIRPIPLTDHGTVENIEVDDHRISFTTQAVGLPHLVKVSYFPNWHATGAEGPYLVAPSLMLVIPTDSQVVIEFENTWAEWSGWALTFLGVLALAIPRWRRTVTNWATSAGANDSSTDSLQGIQSDN